MASYKIKDNELTFSCELGNTVDFIKDVLSSGDENSNSLDLYKNLLNMVSGFALKNLDEDNRKSYVEHINKFTAGFNIAVKRLSPREGFHYFIKDKHLGDAARTLPLISVFKKYHKDNNTFPIEKIIVITRSAIADLGRVYPNIDEFIVLTRTELSDLTYFLDNIEPGIYRVYSDDYGISPPMKRTYLLPNDLTFASEMLRLPKKLDERSIKKANEVLEEHNATPAKTVVFLPRSYSSSSIPEELLTKAICFFKENGYTLFTNAGGDTEPTLSGTYRLDVAPTTVLALGQMGCLMIGAQCGMMDMMQWFKININCIIVFLLQSKNDFTYSRNRGLTKRITHKETSTYIMLGADEIGQLSDEIIAQSKYYIKGIAQNNNAAPKKSFEFYHSANLNQYAAELAKLEHVVIFISVYDSANTHWNAFESRHLLGLKEDLSKKWRMSYIALIDKDNGICVEKISDKFDGVSYQYSFDDMPCGVGQTENAQELPRENNCWLFSCGMDSLRYTKSSICINGVEHSMSKRGLNIVVYSKDEGRVIDSASVDLFGDSAMSVKRGTDVEKI